MLEVEVTDVEIKKAVWDCGKNKSTGPDGVTFEFVRKFWDVIGGDVCQAPKSFFRSGLFRKGCNPSFITLIPKVNDVKFVKDFCPISLIRCQYKIVGKILANRLSSVIGSLVSKEQSAFIRGRQIFDGPLILSEVIDWCNQKKRKAMIFKVDFEKAYDSVPASILVNGSPTQEFYFEQGLRHGDPLSPILFLLVMEALHISFVRAMDRGFFKGIHVGSHELVHISHLFYAYDAVFIGERREENLRHLVSILHCFYLALGLRINIHKCCIMGVGGVTNVEVYRGAQMIGCEASKTPFKYLGVMVGGKMNRLHSWDVVIDKVTARLSKWKVKTLSIGVPIEVLKHLESCRSNFFRGMDPGARKVSWFSWDSIVVSKEVGGLGMSSFFAMNCALLFKWIWRRTKRCLYVIKFIMVSFMGLEDRQGGAEGVQMEEASNLIDSLEFVEDHDKWVWNLEGDGVFKSNVLAWQGLTSDHLFFLARLLLPSWLRFEVKEGGERLLGRYDVCFMVDHLELSQ
ncbi:RNA-directed DNA polymerase, eukaryota [Tanacetum coccineum]